MFYDKERLYESTDSEVDYSKKDILSCSFLRLIYSSPYNSVRFGQSPHSVILVESRLIKYCKSKKQTEAALYWLVTLSQQEIMTSMGLVGRDLRE